eukprot:471374_1
MSNGNLNVNGSNGILGKLDDIDRRWSDAIAALELGTFIEFFIIIPTILFSPVGVPLFVILNIFYYKSFVFVVSMVLGLIFSEGIKMVACRARPKLQSHKPLNITQYVMKVDSFSMPSGDTLQASIFGVIVTYHLGFPLWLYIFVPWAAFGRVYWGNHWIGDTVVGGAIGIIVSYIICINFEELLKHNFF